MTCRGCLLVLLAAPAFGQWATAYSPTEANYYAQMCGAAYCAEHRIKKWDCSACAAASKNFALIQYFGSELASKDISGFVGHDPDRDIIVVSFSGTDPLDIRNWVDDLQFAQEDAEQALPGLCSSSSSGSSSSRGTAIDENNGRGKAAVRFLQQQGAEAHSEASAEAAAQGEEEEGKEEACSVHSGFLRSYLSVRSQVTRSIHFAMAEHPTASLHVTGHSLGAALATLAALDLVTLGIAVGAVYTFGQPRVGDPQFAQAYRSSIVDGGIPHWRVTHAADPIVHLPPVLPVPPISFRHVPREVWYPAEGFNTSSYVVCQDEYEDPGCSNSLVLPGWLPDHNSYLGIDFIINYLECKL